MSPEPVLLLGAGRTEESVLLEERLRGAGVRVDLAAMGLEIIERALFNRYDAILIDASVSLLEPAQVRELLKHNPRTQTVPVFMLDLPGLGGMETQPDFVPRPLAGLDWLQGAVPLKGARSEDPEGTLRADLQEIPLPDLIQMLSQNRRRGVLEIESAAGRGRIEIIGEEMGQAQVDSGPVGVKALVRMLGWTQGRARFQPVPGLRPEQELGAAVNVLMDALRLRDEEARFREEIPEGSRLVYQTRRDAGVPVDALHERILMLIDFFGSVDEILDRLEAPDADVLRGIRSLAEQGWVEVVTPSTGAGGPEHWADLRLPAESDGLPVVWVFGQDAQLVRSLWGDARLQKRLISRRSLRNPGRWGGNGWVLDAGGGRSLWLRWLAPDRSVLPFVLRRSRPLGALMVLTPGDEEWLDDYRALAVQLLERGIRTAWMFSEEVVGADAHEQVFRDQALADLPGPQTHAGKDPVVAFWTSLEALLGDDAV